MICASLKKNVNGQLYMIKRCCVCGDKKAPFGTNVNMRLALKFASERNKGLCQKHMGQWYCLKHYKELKDEK